ncbi:MAG: hypothetical protein P1P65_08900 [Treponema sp.]
MDERSKELKTVMDIVPITETWQEIPFEELEERLELKCGTYCNKNNNI